LRSRKLCTVLLWQEMLLTFLNCMSYKQTGTWAFRDRLQVFSRTVAAPRQGPSSRSQS
jgi:hypothetical protein